MVAARHGDPGLKIPPTSESSQAFLRKHICIEELVSVNHTAFVKHMQFTSNPKYLFGMICFSHQYLIILSNYNLTPVIL